jgi:glycosyltransferase involved in cell wall biosynthesis
MQQHADNIVYLARVLNDSDLCEMQNRLGAHVSVSCVEGFGHSIVEAMSCQSAIVTTNAPPMNELIQPGRGFLADYGSTAPMHLGTQYFVDLASLEKQIGTVIGIPVSALQRIGESARAWYVQNDQFFRQRLVEVVKNL